MEIPRLKGQNPVSYQTSPNHGLLDPIHICKPTLYSLNLDKEITFLGLRSHFTKSPRKDIWFVYQVWIYVPFPMIFENQDLMCGIFLPASSQPNPFYVCSTQDSANPDPKTPTVLVGQGVS